MKALTVTSSNFLQQWAYNTENLNQQFQIQEENHRCKLVNLQTNQSVSVNDKSNGAPIQIEHQQTMSVWELIEADGFPENRYWNVLMDEKLGEICDNNEREKLENKLTLKNCLNWCNIDQRTKFCMWNFLDDEEQMGTCIAANQCENRTIIQNEKYRIYIHRMFYRNTSSENLFVL
jgi:hypothetical protein